MPKESPEHIAMMSSLQLADAEWMMDSLLEDYEDIESYEILKEVAEDSDIWYVKLKDFDWDEPLTFGSGLTPSEAALDACRMYAGGVVIAD